MMERLNKFGVPATESIRLLKDLKSGLMFIEDKNGGREIIAFYDKVFDSKVSISNLDL
jgi:hypothetical protein